MTDKKTVEKFHCYSCDSEFKLIYHDDDVSSYPKFCSFCGTELDFDENEEEDKPGFDDD